MAEPQKYEIRILKEPFADQVVQFERRLLESQPGSEMEKEMASWTAPWRKEALDHYLPLGWSFGLFEKDQLVAYGLGQPLLFFRSQTQTLWLEHLQAETPEQQEMLLDTFYRWARDKHLQVLLVNELVFPEKMSDFDFPWERSDLGNFLIRTSKTARSLTPQRG